MIYFLGTPIHGLYVGDVTLPLSTSDQLITYCTELAGELNCFESLLCRSPVFLLLNNTVSDLSALEPLAC